MAGASTRPQTRRDSAASGRSWSSRVISATAASVSPVAPRAGSWPVSWACAHAQLDARSGSSLLGSAGAADGEDRQRAAARRRELHAGLGAHDDEAQPGAQPLLGGGGGGREQPGQARLVELDQRAVVGLERPRARRRVGADHLADLQPGHVARAHEAHAHRDRGGVVDGQRCGGGGDARLVGAERVGLRQRRRSPRRTHGTSTRSALVSVSLAVERSGHRARTESADRRECAHDTVASPPARTSTAPMPSRPATWWASDHVIVVVGGGGVVVGCSGSTTAATA